jgi:hypothetical protein
MLPDEQRAELIMTIEEIAALHPILERVPRGPCATHSQLGSPRSPVSSLFIDTEVSRQFVSVVRPAF